MLLQESFNRYVMAVERVGKLLRDVTEALEAARVPYAVVGGNAVAAWVATVDEGAVRATKDVDLLLNRASLVEAAHALRPMGMIPIEVLGVHMWVGERNPNPKTGVHVVIAGELIRPHYRHPAPDVHRIAVIGHLNVIDLAALVEMKLQAFRFIDRAHIQDMLAVGLLDEAVRKLLPSDLLDRLGEIEAAPN